jgi:hypothetical protein
MKNQKINCPCIQNNTGREGGIGNLSSNQGTGCFACSTFSDKRHQFGRLHLGSSFIKLPPLLVISPNPSSG